MREQDITSHHITSHHITSHHITSHHITSSTPTVLVLHAAATCLGLLLDVAAAQCCRTQTQHNCTAPAAHALSHMGICCKAH
jgi:hypothetical protein